MSEPVFVGLDYHQAFVQVCVLDRERERSWRTAAARTTVTLSARAVGQHGSEVRPRSRRAAGRPTWRRSWSPRTAGQSTWRHPGYVARIKQSPDKTDFSDARLLADLERVGYLPKVWLAPEKVRQLRRLVRYRQQLVAERRNVKLRIGALLREERIAATAGGCLDARLAGLAADDHRRSASRAAGSSTGNWPGWISSSQRSAKSNSGSWRLSPATRSSRGFWHSRGSGW